MIDLTRRGLMAAAAAFTAVPAFAQDDTESGTAPVIEDIILGDPDAPVEVIEYVSFTCPHCATWHREVYPRIREEYVDTGRVRFVMREVYFDRFGLWGSMLARCDGGMRFYGIADLLLSQQAEWSRAGDPAAIVTAMRRIGAQAGLSAEQMDQCLTDQAMAEALVANYQANAEEHGITGTPSFVIDGERYSNMGFDAMSEIIEERLAANES
ncbi:MAG: DsbA family protein [Rubricella sp.]